jgi:hypoxanthine phosphoribosyltransferase
MDTITILDKKFSLFIGEERINESIACVAKQVSDDYHATVPVFVVVLKGAFMFAAQLFKGVTIPAEIHFVRLQSYRGVESSGVIREILGLDIDVNGRDVIIVEDIVDTGYTMAYLTDQLRRMGARDVAVCTLFDKPQARKNPVDIKYAAITISNEFIVGYGLDYNEQGRNLPQIYKIEQ